MISVVAENFEIREPFGVEITAPALVDLDALSELLHDLHVHEVEPADLAPLRAA
jgi:hypothetical protein